MFRIYCRHGGPRSNPVLMPYINHLRDLLSTIKVNRYAKSIKEVDLTVSVDGELYSYVGIIPGIRKTRGKPFLVGDIRIEIEDWDGNSPSDIPTMLEAKFNACFISCCNWLIQHKELIDEQGFRAIFAEKMHQFRASALRAGEVREAPFLAVLRRIEAYTGISVQQSDDLANISAFLDNELLEGRIGPHQYDEINAALRKIESDNGK